MKIKLEIDENLAEDVITIQCREINEEILELQRRLTNFEASGQKILAEQNDTEYYLDLKMIIFLESDGNSIAIHTPNDVFRTKQKLYELEELLPRDFIRVSKSTIVNTRAIASIKKNITGASELSFRSSTKKAYASRNYIKALLEIMNEKRLRK